ncbi:methyltransferase domain-containing protein [Phormidium tenue FACHB-886]|nr:methyltransferase domain-containing protein [Phormidium tenue FACHB-886]
MANVSNHWNAARYETQHAFVWQYGKSLIELLSPQSSERILDLGCGTGQLTAELAAIGAQVEGIDASSAMIEQATQNYPHLSFSVADARTFQVAQPFDAVFSNAVLHWITEPDTVIHQVRQSLKIGGRFVAEFGGRGNIEGIQQALQQAIAPYVASMPNPWFFPSLSEYASRLERQGFEVVYAVLFDRPTLLQGGEEGLANWLQTFANAFLTALPAETQHQVIQTIEAQLRATHYTDGSWTADYRRLRVAAIQRD